jgi:hypothetical protein
VAPFAVLTAITTVPGFAGLPSVLIEPLIVAVLSCASAGDGTSNAAPSAMDSAATNLLRPNFLMFALR